MVSNTNKITAGVLIAALVIALGVYVFVNLPNQTQTEETQPPTPPQTNTVLTVTINGHDINYTLAQLESFDAYTAKGGYRTSFPAIKGQGNYTGVRVQKLIDSLGYNLENYSLIVFSSDGSNKTFNYTTVCGNVPYYNPENASDENPLGHGNLTLVLAYKYEGDYLNASKDGVLKTTFLNDQGAITSSGYWWKFVDKIQVVPNLIIT
jgi:hypothetical protein